MLTMNWLRELPKTLLIAAGVLAAIALIFVLVVVAIPNTDHGVVLARTYHEAYDVWVPSSTTCYSYDSNGHCTYESTTPAHYDHHPERWTVRVRDEEGVEETLGVGEGVYLGCDVGRWYPGNGEPCQLR